MKNFKVDGMKTISKFEQKSISGGSNITNLMHYNLCRAACSESTVLSGSSKMACYNRCYERYMLG